MVGFLHVLPGEVPNHYQFYVQVVMCNVNAITCFIGGAMPPEQLVGLWVRVGESNSPLDTVHAQVGAIEIFK